MSRAPAARHLPRHPLLLPTPPLPLLLPSPPPPPPSPAGRLRPALSAGPAAAAGAAVLPQPDPDGHRHRELHRAHGAHRPQDRRRQRLPLHLGCARAGGARVLRHGGGSGGGVGRGWGVGVWGVGRGWGGGWVGGSGESVGSGEGTSHLTSQEARGVARCCWVAPHLTKACPCSTATPTAILFTSRAWDPPLPLLSPAPSPSSVHAPLRLLSAALNIPVPSLPLPQLIMNVIPLPPPCLRLHFLINHDSSPPPDPRQGHGRQGG